MRFSFWGKSRPIFSKGYLSFRECVINHTNPPFLVEPCYVSTVSLHQLKNQEKNGWNCSSASRPQRPNDQKSRLQICFEGLMKGRHRLRLDAFRVVASWPCGHGTSLVGYKWGNDDFLVCGWTNPSENICSSNWIISPGKGKNKTYLKPPPSFVKGSCRSNMRFPIVDGFCGATQLKNTPLISTLDNFSIGSGGWT